MDKKTTLVVFKRSWKAQKFIFVVLAISLCVVAVFLNTYIVYTNKPDTSYDMYLTVDDHVGVNADPDAIWFGTIPPDGTGTRRLVLSEDDWKYVTIKTAGELASWVSVSDNNFVLAPNVSKTVEVYAAVPTDAEYKDYTGKLNIYYN